MTDDVNLNLRPRRILSSLLSCALIAIVVAGCSSGKQDEATSEDGGSASSLVVNSAIAPSTLDPAVACNLPESGVVGNFYARLTQFAEQPGPEETTQWDPDPNAVEPWLAESWKVTNGGKTYTFKLRDGLRFPSGEPVDAEAVKYSLDRVIEMNQCGLYFLIAGQYDPLLIEEVVAEDPTTVRIELATKDTSFLQLMAQPAAGIVDASVIDANGGVQKDKISKYMTSHVAGYGPFTLGEYQPNTKMELVANPDYYDPPSSERITMNFVKDNSTMVLQAESGEADISIYMQKESIAQLADSDCCTVVANDQNLYETIPLPWGLKPLDNVKVREALIRAVPYEDIRTRVAYGYAEPYWGQWLPASPWFDEAAGAPLEQDLDAAKALIAESGVETPIELDLRIIEGSTTQEQIATVVQDAWQELGVELNIQKVSSADFYEKIYEPDKTGLAVVNDGPAVVTPQFFVNYDSICGADFNTSDMCVKELDKLAAKLPQADEAERLKLTEQINEIWKDAWPRVNVYQDTFAAVLSDAVTSYHFNQQVDMRKWAK